MPGTAAIAARWPRYHSSHVAMRPGSCSPLSLVKIIAPRQHRPVGIVNSDCFVVTWSYIGDQYGISEARMSISDQTLEIRASEFKAKCLELMDRLAARKLTRIVVTK